MKRARPRPLRFRVDEGLALMAGGGPPSPRLDRARTCRTVLTIQSSARRRMSYSPSCEEKCRGVGLWSQADDWQRLARWCRPVALHPPANHWPVEATKKSRPVGGASPRPLAAAPGPMQHGQAGPTGSPPRFQGRQFGLQGRRVGCSIGKLVCRVVQSACSIAKSFAASPSWFPALRGRLTAAENLLQLRQLGRQLRQAG